VAAARVAKVLGKGKVKVTWFDGTQSDVAVGATGVLPRGDVPASMAVGRARAARPRLEVG
jgi:hypothetical protein